MPVRPIRAAGVVPRAACYDPRGVDTVPHVVLLGDSIFDNAPYTNGGPDVIYANPIEPSSVVGEKIACAIVGLVCGVRRAVPSTRIIIE